MVHGIGEEYIDLLIVIAMVYLGNVGAYSRGRFGKSKVPRYFSGTCSEWPISQP